MHLSVELATNHARIERQALHALRCAGPTTTRPVAATVQSGVTVYMYGGCWQQKVCIRTRCHPQAKLYVFRGIGRKGYALGNSKLCIYQRGGLRRSSGCALHSASSRGVSFTYAAAALPTASAALQHKQLSKPGKRPAAAGRPSETEARPSLLRHTCRGGPTVPLFC